MGTGKSKTIIIILKFIDFGAPVYKSHRYPQIVLIIYYPYLVKYSKSYNIYYIGTLLLCTHTNIMYAEITSLLSQYLNVIFTLLILYNKTS